MARWHYMGDMTLECGGLFMEFSSWKYDYTTVIRVDDLKGINIVEELTVSVNHSERWESALQTTGASLLPNHDINDNGHTIYKRGTLAWRMCLIYALIAYGAYDVDRSQNVQSDRNGPTKIHGMSEAIRVRSLRRYVRREFLGLSR